MTPPKRPRVLILANDFNPDWPSLPVVGYKYAQFGRAHYVDTEWLARSLYKLTTWLRGGEEGAWSLRAIMNYLPYLEFERQAVRQFRKALRAGEFDIVHRITPMSPTTPSVAAGRTAGVPFVLGPLNGSLPWPEAFKKELVRERERLRMLRNAYKYLPFARSTYRHAAAVLASFQHTQDDLKQVDPARMVSFPEIGFDPELFHAKGRQRAFSGDGPFTILYAGRLVPYKVPEVVVQAFVSSDLLRQHRLRIIGAGPEEARLREIVAHAGAEENVIFEGRKTQAEIAQAMREADAFVFPSIRELGAGVVIEAMASGPVTVVTDYGAPGDLVGQDRGISIPIKPLDTLVQSYRDALEGCITDPETHAALADNAKIYAAQHFEWDRKADFTHELYKAILEGRNPAELNTST